ncbi:TetR/AcrR family transcriptional regulator [Streptomyces orinoci]|uniref:TetR family transcriptional regulator n=1 Tax=Streptomyces orinoci TaxID=67339 RepID=A0ABV3JYM8_STRON|nr:TetR family transcriptional regulator [Streptomyces orinoci]
MEAKDGIAKQAGGRGRTFTEEARRAQIVGAAIEVLADAGYAKATFSRIAKQAGLSSTGMISYHFSGKDDLMREVAAEVLRVAEAYMLPRIQAESSYSGRLRAYIESNVALLEVHPKHLPALAEVMTNQRGDTPTVKDFVHVMEATMNEQAERIRLAQRDGAFREFDPMVMTAAIRGAIDFVVTQASRLPGFDATTYGRELADLFDRATRRTP